MKANLVILFQKINDAQQQLIAERSQPHTPAELDLIRQGINQLSTLASDVLLLDLTQQADQIDQQANALTALADQINQTTDSLAHIADVLNDIAAKVGAVLSVTATLSTAGLL